jgi:hypothetical protein
LRGLQGFADFTPSQKYGESGSTTLQCSGTIYVSRSLQKRRNSSQSSHRSPDPQVWMMHRRAHIEPLRFGEVPYTSGGRYSDSKHEAANYWIRCRIRQEIRAESARQPSNRVCCAMARCADICRQNLRIADPCCTTCTHKKHPSQKRALCVTQDY